MSWLDQDDGPGELGADHGAPVAAPASTPWHIGEHGVDIQASGNAAAGWDTPVHAGRPEEGLGVTRSGAAGFGAVWSARRAAVTRWSRWYGVPSEILVGLCCTESAPLGNARSCAVEPVSNPTRGESRDVRDARWAALGCGAIPGGAAHVPAVPPAAPNNCAAYDAWFTAHENMRAQMLGLGNVVPVGNAALVANLVTRVEAFAPDHISPGIIQTLISTARDALSPELGANAALIVTTPWLLETYDPDGASNSIRAGAAYVLDEARGHATLFDPPLVSAAYNRGLILASGDAQNRWRMVQFDAAGGHTNRFVAFFNDAVDAIRDDLARPPDNFHEYDHLHLDSFLLHHSRWEVEFVLGDRRAVPGPADAPLNPARFPTQPDAAGDTLRVAGLALAYTRTNPPAYPPLPGGAAPPAAPTAADQQRALHALTAFVAAHLDSYLTDTANPATRVWMRLLWTFARDETTLKGVRHDHNARIRGRVTDAADASPLPDVRVVLESPSIEVAVSRSGHYVMSHRAASFPVAVRLRVKSGAFLSVPTDARIAFPGETLVSDVALVPITVSAPPAPHDGPAAGGTVVTIAGAGLLAGKTQVEFGGVAATAVNATGAQATATTPSHAAGTVEVKITTRWGTYTIADGFRFT